MGSDCEFPTAAKRKFDRLSPFGLRTRLATSPKDKWGYDPSWVIRAEPGQLSPVHDSTDGKPVVDLSRHVVESLPMFPPADLMFELK